MKILKQGLLSEVLLTQADYLEQFPDDRHTFAFPGEEPWFIEGRVEVLKFAEMLRALAVQRRDEELAQWN
jgi:hypothetical protein